MKRLILTALLLCTTHAAQTQEAEVAVRQGRMKESTMCIIASAAQRYRTADEIPRHSYLLAVDVMDWWYDKLLDAVEGFENLAAYSIASAALFGDIDVWRTEDRYNHCVYRQQQLMRN